MSNGHQHAATLLHKLSHALLHPVEGMNELTDLQSASHGQRRDRHVLPEFLNSADELAQWSIDPRQSPDGERNDKQEQKSDRKQNWKRHDDELGQPFVQIAVDRDSLAFQSGFDTKHFAGRIVAHAALDQQRTNAVVKTVVEDKPQTVCPIICRSGGARLGASKTHTQIIGRHGPSDFAPRRQRRGGHGLYQCDDLQGWRPRTRGPGRLCRPRKRGKDCHNDKCRQERAKCERHDLTPRRIEKAQHPPAPVYWLF